RSLTTRSRPRKLRLPSTVFVLCVSGVTFHSRCARKYLRADEFGSFGGTTARTTRYRMCSVSWANYPYSSSQPIEAAEMTVPPAADRTPERRALDEAIAAEPPLAPPDLPPQRPSGAGRVTLAPGAAARGRGRSRRERPCPPA